MMIPHISIKKYIQIEILGILHDHWYTIKNVTKYEIFNDHIDSPIRLVGASLMTMFSTVCPVVSHLLFGKIVKQIGL